MQYGQGLVVLVEFGHGTRWRQENWNQHRDLPETWLDLVYQMAGDCLCVPGEHPMRL